MDKNRWNKVTVELKLKIFLMLNFEMEKEEAIQIRDLDKKYSTARILELMDPLTLKRILVFALVLFAEKNQNFLR